MIRLGDSNEVGFHRNPRLDERTSAPTQGLLARVKDQFGGWAGPDASRDTEAMEDLRDERVKRGPPGVVIPNFLPYINEQTSGIGENQAMRQAYRKMLGDANIKAALLSKLFAVAALDLKIHPADKKNKRDQEVAEFVRWVLIDQLGGTPKLVESILLPGCVDGYSVCEKVHGDPADKGKWAGKIPLIDLASLDVGNDVVPETDDRKRIVSYLGLRYNAGQHFHPAYFVHWTHLGLYGQPTGMSDFRASYRPFWVCDTAWKLWLLSLQFRAGGLLVGTYENTSVKASIETAFKAARTHGYLVIPKSVAVQVINMAAGGETGAFDAAMKAAKHDMFLSISGSYLSQLEGETADGAGNSSVHLSTEERRQWWLARQLESILNGNGRQAGIIKDEVDINFVVGDYPRATLSAVDQNEVKAKLEIYTQAKALGLDLSKRKAYEDLDIEPPNPDDPTDALTAAPPPQPGMPGAPGDQGGQPPGQPGEEEGGFDSFAEQDWVRSDGKRGGKRWVNVHSGQAVYSKDNPSRTQRRAANTLAGKGKAHAGMMGRLASFGSASWESLKKAGHTAEQVEQVASAFVADNVGAAVAKLPRALQLPVVGAWKMVRLGTAAAFATYIAGQEMAERVATEAGATPEEAKRLRKVCSRIDATAGKATAITLEHIGLGHLAPLAAVPLGSATYLAYSVATKPLSVLRAARKAVAEAAAKVGGLFRHSEADDAAKAMLLFLQAHRGKKADWADACLLTALDHCPDANESLEVAEAACEGGYEAFAEDAAGHEHAGKGPKGGEFVSKGKGGTATKEGGSVGKKDSHPGAAHGSSVTVKPTKQRAFNGEPAVLKTTLTKQETGRVGEAVVLAYLKRKGFKDARPMNTAASNFPVDMLEDHRPTEVKAGLASNSRKAQQWRLTFSKESATEKALYETMTPEERKTWNTEKQRRIHERKMKVIQQLEKQTGKKVHPRTMTVIINPDTKTADIYVFDGLHDRIDWQSPQGKAGYEGSVRYG